jgi:hypothetical protein
LLSQEVKWTKDGPAVRVLDGQWDGQLSGRIDKIVVNIGSLLLLGILSTLLKVQQLKDIYQMRTDAAL